MIRINLLPVRAAQKKEKIRSQVSVVVLSLVFVCMLCGAEYFRMSTKISAKQDEVKKVQQEINQLKKKIGEVSRYKKLQQDLKKKLDILQVLKENKSGPVHSLNELSLSLPDQLWINSFSIKGLQVKIDGIGFSEADVAEFMKNLENSEYYQNIDLNVTQQTKMGAVKLQKFALTGQTAKPADK